MLVLPTTTHSLQVAILGSGMAGSTAARTLADRGIKVTVFEAGRGIGGRMSTRTTRDEGKYQFDHGAQYISKPKSDVFQTALDEWRRDGWVKQWSGKFGTATHRGVKIEKEEEEEKERWVGYPTMNSICRNLLEHENIHVELQTRANAVYKTEKEEGNNNNNEEKNNNNNDTKRWTIIHGKNKKHLGSYDWLIVTDRNSAAHFRKDLSLAKNALQDFRKGVRSIQSVKCLVSMVVFEKSLPLDVDGIQCDDYDNNGFGSLGWVARDTSKPGREREDGKECWVLQSHPDAAKEILKGMKNIKDIREKAKDVLLQDFLTSIPLLLAGDGDDDHETAVELPAVTTAVGHRWGAAFPIPSEEYVDMDCQLIADRQFMACGDYFGKLSGRIEGAYLSGLSAADRLCRELE